MLACGCAWLRSRFAPLTAAAASLPGRCRLRRNAGLCLTRGMRGLRREALPCPLAIPDDASSPGGTSGQFPGRGIWSIVIPGEAGHAPFFWR